MSTLSTFLHKQRTRWHRRGIDPAHRLRRHLAYYVAEHGFEIGDHSIGEPTIRLYNRSKLKVGRYSSIAFDSVFIMGGVHRTDTVTTSLLDLPRGYGSPVPDIVVGSDVWIAGSTVIVSGVTIGDGAVVGAGAVVIDDVPPYGVVFGNPARLIRRRFAEDIISELLRLRWWDLDDAQVQSLRPVLQGSDVTAAIDALRGLKGLPPWERKSLGSFPAAAPAMGKMDGQSPRHSEAEICQWCIEYLARVLRVPASTIDPATRFARLGIDSMTAITLVFEVEQWLGVELHSDILFEQPTILDFARYLADKRSDRSRTRRTA